MTTLAVTILDRAAQSLGGFLPRVLGALLLLVVGILLARLIGRIVTRAMESAGLDSLAERFGANDVIGKAGLGDSLSLLVAGRCGSA